VRYKVNDVAYYKKLNNKCTIQEVHHNYYLICYVHAGILRYQKVVPEDLSDFFVNCPVCGKVIRVINGLVDNHSKEKDRVVCYGSYLPQK